MYLKYCDGSVPKNSTYIFKNLFISVLLILKFYAAVLTADPVLNIHRSKRFKIHRQ